MRPRAEDPLAVDLSLRPNYRLTAPSARSYNLSLALRCMFPGVITWRLEFEIPGLVVELVLVEVMYVLIEAQQAAEDILHHGSML